MQILKIIIFHWRKNNNHQKESRKNTMQCKLHLCRPPAWLNHQRFLRLSCLFALSIKIFIIITFWYTKWIQKPRHQQITWVTYLMTGIIESCRVSIYINIFEKDRIIKNKNNNNNYNYQNPIKLLCFYNTNKRFY